MKAPISIKVNHLKKKLGTTKALDDITLTFDHGKMHGIIGPEGAGKTTLMRVILDLLKPDSGTVQFIQQDKKYSLERFRNWVTYMPQSQSLYPDLSIDEHLEFFKELYQIDTKDYQRKREELLEITQLQNFTDRLASQLSGGMYKKLGLMCALLRSPEVMLLDEPTNGVDPISRREFWDLLYRLLDQNILILVSTAYMDEAERCSVVHLLEAGHVVAEGEPRELLQKQKVKSFDELFLKAEGGLDDSKK
jgi:ABC-2 type transport system ATP-binding protein